MSPDRYDYGGDRTERETRKFREYQIRQDQIAWDAVRRLSLESAKTQVASLFSLCDAYGFARSCDLQNQSTQMGAIVEKEQRRRAKQLAATIRKVATQIHEVRHGELSGAPPEIGQHVELSKAQIAERILSRRLRRAFWSDDGSGLNSGLETGLLKLADSIERCLEGVPGTKEFNTQAKIWGNRRENALLGPEGGGYGMVSLASKRKGKADYGALVKIVLVFYPNLAGLRESELAREVERRSAQRSKRTSRENNIPG